MMPIQDVQFTDKRWLQFWEHYKGLPHQKKSVIKLGQHIKQADPGLEAAEPVQNRRESASCASRWR